MKGYWAHLQKEVKSRLKIENNLFMNYFRLLLLHYYHSFEQNIAHSKVGATLYFKR